MLEFKETYNLNEKVQEFRRRVSQPQQEPYLLTKNNLQWLVEREEGAQGEEIRRRHWMDPVIQLIKSQEDTQIFPITMEVSSCENNNNNTTMASIWLVLVEGVLDPCRALTGRMYPNVVVRLEGKILSWGELQVPNLFLHLYYKTLIALFLKPPIFHLLLPTQTQKDLQQTLELQGETWENKRKE